MLIPQSTENHFMSIGGFQYTWVLDTYPTFDVTQVIGLYNNDPVSEKYWPLKQIIERLNRSFKGNYKPMTGFGSQAGSIAYVELFTTSFNFLRPQTSLEKVRIPVQLDALAKGEDMP
ncbi:hypothetical protein [Tuanshanicoccus lijuaniae]|uniref:hypothetical protein n=1 Tax=Aerococcaceae bacterium zg-1292 TaxID=2774330 RepID=UPI001BD8E64F|nr:hypothetical protein [Aerococcaceae bacterium zg-A91]MBS4458561.1 hypothetical protein [Aerococcaceae bacterium zg-BR33]